MPLIINSIDELRKTVKVSASLPFDVVEPFIRSARDLYLVRYLGRELVEILEADTVPTRAVELFSLVKKSLGPLAIWLGGAELSVRISDSGMTVEKNQDKFLPASDTKIQNVIESLERRGFLALDMVLEYLEKNAGDFPEWTESHYYTLRGGNYIQSAVQFQELGLVDIGYSRIKFENMRNLMSLVEQRYVTETIGETLDATLRSKLNGSQTEAEKSMIAAIRKFVACKSAETPFYNDQAEFFLSKIKQLMLKYATEFNVTLVTEAPEFNEDGRKIYFAG